MHNPAERSEADEPHNAGEEEKKDGGQNTTLHELAEAGNKKTAEGSDDVASRTLSCIHHTNRIARKPLVYTANERPLAKEATTCG